MNMLSALRRVIAGSTEMDYNAAEGDSDSGKAFGAGSNPQDEDMGVPATEVSGA